jgi:hypothetical protein
MNPCGANAFEDRDVFRPAVLKESFGIGHAKVMHLASSGETPERRRRSRRKYGQHRYRAIMSEMGQQGAGGKYTVIKVRGYDQNR